MFPKLLAPPSCPVNLQVTTVTSRSVTLAWSPPESTGGTELTGTFRKFHKIRNKNTVFRLFGNCERKFSNHRLRRGEKIIIELHVDESGNSRCYYTPILHRELEGKRILVQGIR